jgi:hypothetical protein
VGAADGSTERHARSTNQQARLFSSVPRRRHAKLQPKQPMAAVSSDSAGSCQRRTTQGGGVVSRVVFIHREHGWKIKPPPKAHDEKRTIIFAFIACFCHACLASVALAPLFSDVGLLRCSTDRRGSGVRKGAPGSQGGNVAGTHGGPAKQLVSASDLDTHRWSWEERGQKDGRV